MKRYVLCACLSLTTAKAQTVSLEAPSPQVPAPQAPTLPPAVPLQIAPRVGIDSVVALSLEQAIAATLLNNRDIEVSRLSEQKATLDLRGAKGYFDPVFGGNAYRLHQVTPVASSLGGGTNGKLTENDWYADPQISGNSRWAGTTYKLDFSSAQVKNSNTYNTLNPTYPTSVTLNLQQPLWGGLLFDQNRERLSVARKNVQQTQEEFEQRVITTTTQAIRAYWELDYARRNLAVQIEAVRLAEQQDASNRRQVEQGIEAPTDVIQTQTQLSTYQQNVFNAQEDVTRAENTLKALLLPSRQDPLWSAEIQTAVSPDQAASIPSLTEALHQALTSRPDLKAGQTGIQVSTLEARLASEQAKPQVTLTAQVGAQGLAGRVVTGSTDIFTTAFTPLFDRINELSALAGLAPISTTGLGTTTSVPDFFVGGYGQSLDTLRNGYFPIVKVGLQASIPFRNRTARAEAGVADANRKQAVTQQQQLEMTVESDVRNSLQQLSNASLLLNAAHRAAQLAEAQYDSEQRQLKAGTSSVYLVLQRQNELISARLRQNRATADLGEAQADYDRATAGTLQRYHIDVKAMGPQQH